MYLIEDESFTKLLDGEYYQVIIAKKLNPELTVSDLYNYQFKYDSYQGFRKFYRKHLEPILDGIRMIEDKSILGKTIRWITKEQVPNNEKNK